MEQVTADEVRMAMPKLLASLFLLLILLSLVAACSPQSIASQASTPTLTEEILPTATSHPTRKLQTTQTPTPVLTNTPILMPAVMPSSCPRLMEARISTTGFVTAIYDYVKIDGPIGGDAESDGISTPPPQFHYQYRVDQYSPRPLWSWNEQTRAMTPFPLLKDANRLDISDDQQWIVYRRDLGISRSEFWVVDSNGQNEKRLAEVSLAGVRSRHPNLQNATLEYGWVPGTDKLFYDVTLPSEENGNLSNNTVTRLFIIFAYSRHIFPILEDGFTLIFIRQLTECDHLARRF